MASAGRLPRHADVFLAGICAEHLVDGLRAAGLIVARPVEWRRTFQGYDATPDRMPVIDLRKAVRSYC